MMPRAFLILPFFASLLLLLYTHRAYAAADCSTAKCGNLTVKYPFWLGGPSQSPSDPSCGHPAFELSCIGNGSAGASMRGSSLHVLRIDYNSSSFIASHARVAAGEDGVCRTDFNMSISLALSPFKISATNRALCFLYGCVNGTEPTGGPGFVNATGVPGCGKPIVAYLGGSYDRDAPPAIGTGSCMYAYLPVLGTAAAGATAGDYGRLLKSGFLLEWAGTGVGDECPGCVASGGGCRYRNGSTVCLCPGGELRRPTCAGQR